MSCCSPWNTNCQNCTGHRTKMQKEGSEQSINISISNAVLIQSTSRELEDVEAWEISYIEQAFAYFEKGK